jgi:hypothetical protein
MVVLLLALPGLQAGDKPNEQKKAPTPKERYDALMMEFTTQQRQLGTEIQKSKGDEQQKVVGKYFFLGDGFAEKVYKIAEENPNDPVAAEALFWIVENGVNNPHRRKALEKILALVGEMPHKDLVQGLKTMRGAGAFVIPWEIMEAVLKRAQKDDKEPQASDLLAWVARSGRFTGVGQKALDELVQKHIDHPAMEQVCANLGSTMQNEERAGALAAMQATLGSGSKTKAGDTLKRILDKSSQPCVKAAAALAVGQGLASKSDRLADNPMESDKVAAEAVKYLAMIDQFGKDVPEETKKNAERVLKALRTVRVGKTAPEISANDLDEKPFKLSDYKGKVVLLDFWGNS